MVLHRRNWKKLAASLFLTLSASSSAKATEIFLNEGFEGFTLNPYTSPSETPSADGTDWTDQLPAGWGRTVTAPEGNPIEFRGWNIHDVDSWIVTEGDQERSTWTRGGVGARGSVLVVDPDAFDDGTDIDGSHMFATVSTPPVNLSQVNNDKVTILVDSFFRNEEPMDLSIDVSTNGGSTFSNLWSITSENLPDGQVYDQRLAFQVDNPGTGSLVVKFSLLDAANDWWWALDNVLVADSLPEFKIVVDTADGDVAIVNGSDEAVDLKGYMLTSASGSLDLSKLEGLETNGLAGDGWLQNGNATGSLLAETNFDGSILIEPGKGLYLGQLFKSGAAQDLAVQMIGATGPAGPGFIEYDDLDPNDYDDPLGGPTGPLGDTDDDGDVDLDDLNNVRNNFGSVGAGDTDGDNDVDLDDLNNVRNNFGAVGSVANPVPEPSSIVLLAMAACGGLGWVARRRR